MDRNISSDPLAYRGLPSNVDAERSILGAILLDNSVCNQAVQMLRRDEFFLESHRSIYEKMLVLNDRSVMIDHVTLSEELRRSGEFERVGGMTYIASLIDGVPRTDNIEYYARIVKDKARLRRLIDASNQIIARCVEEEEDTRTIIDAAERMIFEIAEDTAGRGFRHIREIARKRIEEIEEMAGRPEMITGIPTGFIDLDVMTAGFQRQDLIVIAARPSMGKTALALNIGVSAAKAGFVIGIFSLEMSAEQLVTRVLCSESRIDAHRLRTGYLNREEWARLADGLRRVCDTEIYIDDTPGQGVLEMRAKARRQKAEHGLHMLVVDYMQLMSGRGRIESRQQEVAQISRDLKAMARELDVPVVALSQLSRAPETRGGDHRPKLSDLRESGAIEQDADVVCFIFREEVYTQDAGGDNEGKAELIVAKQRNGPTGDIKLVFLKQFTRFEALALE
jgi:replicative DNA helicase